MHRPVIATWMVRDLPMPEDRAAFRSVLGADFFLNACCAGSKEAFLFWLADKLPRRLGASSVERAAKFKVSGVMRVKL